MGDTGSFGLGGALAAMAVFTKTEFLLVLIGGVFVIEALSVVIQVVCFKTTGKRVFLMAPIHHHFEMLEWTENKIIVRFWIAGLDLRRQRLRPLLPGLLQVPVSGERYVVVGPAPLGPGGAARRSGGCGRDAAVIAADDAAGRRRGQASRARASNTWPGDEAVSDCGRDSAGQEPGRAREARPLVAAARAAGVPVWSEVELACAACCRTRSSAITGTNGKTTTTELIGAMLRAGGVAVEVAGNVGRALSELPGRIAPDAWIACELSSFQLEDIDTFRARVGVILNVTPDHLDRHGSDRASTAPCKLRLFENQTRRRPGGAERRRPAAARRRAARDGPAASGSTADQSDRIDWEHAGIRGEHNLENALAAAMPPRRPSACRARPAIARAARVRPAAPPAAGGGRAATACSFVDDSKATNPEAAIKALTAYRRRRPPDPGRLAQGRLVRPAGRRRRRAGRWRRSYLIGEVGRDDRRGARRGRRRLRRAGGLETAVTAAAADADAGRHGAALAGLRQLRPVPRLRAPRRRVRRSWRREVAVGALTCQRRCTPARRSARRAAQLEYHLLLLVTLGLVAFGLIMVYSASSGTAVVHGRDPPSALLASRASTPCVGRRG